MSVDLCFDTNIILGYATDFENKHLKCQQIFQDARDKRICSRVHNELGRIRVRRRNKIYSDIINYINNKMSLTGFKPSLKLNDNDSRHLNQLLIELRKVPITKTLNYLRSKIREIENGVQNALSKISRPFIQLYNDVVCEISINQCINNMDDCRILSDAVCWAEKNNKLIFCTRDHNDFVKKRNVIYTRIINAKPYDLPDLPLEIFSLDELIP